MSARSTLASTVGVLSSLLALSTPSLAEDWKWDANSEKEIARRLKTVQKVDRLDATWFHVSTARYEIHTQVDANFTAECSLFMDRFRDQLAGVFKGPDRVNRKADVFIFDSQAKFKALLNSSARGWYKFAFDGKGTFTEHALYTYIASAKERSFAKFYRPILLHEGTHQILREHAGARGKLPKWFDEGLATYFQLWDLGKTAAQNLDGRAAAGVVNKEYFKTSFEQKTFPSLDALLEIKDADWAKDDFGPITKGHYAAVESLMVFLMSDAKERKRVAQMYEAAIAGEDPGELLDAKERKRLAEPWLQFAKKLERDTPSR